MFSLNLAVFCKRTEHGKDGEDFIGVRNSLRVKGGTTLDALTFCVGLVSHDGMPAEVEMTVRYVSPPGAELHTDTRPVRISAGHRCSYVRVPALFQLQQAGTYWGIVLLAGVEITRVPLEIEFKTTEPPTHH